MDPVLIEHIAIVESKYKCSGYPEKTELFYFSNINDGNPR